MLSRYRAGFTIAELLIVIVIIAILAAISFVAYSAIQQRAGTTVLGADLRNAATKLAAEYAIEGRYPSSESAALGLIGGSPGTTFQYDVLGSNSSGYCMTAYSDRDVGAFNISHTSKHN